MATKAAKKQTQANKSVLVQPAAKAYSYIRMSTKEQLKGDSLRRQYDKTRAYVKEHNLELVDNYDDIGVSAFRGLNSEHGALSKFLAAVKNGDIPRDSYLIIESMDRLTRQTAITALSILNEIITSGIIVVTLDDGMKYSAEAFATDQYKLFMALGAMMRAHDESLRKSGLLSDAWNEKRRKLRDEGKILTTAIPAWLRVDKPRTSIEPIPERVAVIREIFDLACNGYGIYSIASLLNGRGEKAWGITRQTKLRPKNKAKPIWRDSYIKKILVNRAVLGEFQPHKHEVSPDGKALRTPIGDAIKGYYPQVIPPEVFRDAHLAMDRRRNGARGRKGFRYANLFTGMIHCAHCGAGMRYLDKGTKGGKYLRCSVSVAGAKCNPRSYRYESVEEVILGGLEALDVGKILGGEAASRRLREKKSEREAALVDLESIEKKINNINQMILSDGGALPASTLSLLRSLEHEQEKKKALIGSLAAQTEELLILDPEKRAIVLHRMLKAIRDQSDADKQARARRALAAELQRMIDTIVLRPDTDYKVGDFDYPGWKSYLSDYGFVASLNYRNGEHHVLRGINGDADLLVDRARG